ncbi:wings apart-like protein homolog [Carcharodon carcharias]|uniref:wings apart-like protein homolog n=1 Tax=Carcharodon carcharias TaxID=13397 RepID=UPI001B7E6563|nr:wings apart-like protein homolog [Carcharodon carcharias]XP_041032063.1 wings apart-like protein homolog [Carcharodon carcharias]
MTSRYGKTYSKKGSASNSKFDEVFSGKRAKISTKWGESTFKAHLSQKRPGLKAETVEQPKRQKMEDELLEDPFGFDSDDDSLPVSSRNPVPTKGLQSTESMKPSDEDNASSLLEVNSMVNRPISGDAIVCSKFVALGDVIHGKSAGSAVALCSEIEEIPESGSKLNCLEVKHHDPLREGIEKNSFPKNRNAPENEKKPKTPSPMLSSFKTDGLPPDSWDEIMKNSGSPSEALQRTEYQPWVGGLGRMPCVKNEVSDCKQGKQGGTSLNLDKPLEVRGNQGTFGRVEHTSFKDEEIENDSQPLRSNCRTYCRSNKGKPGGTGMTNFDKIIDGTGKSAHADLTLGKESLKPDTKISSETTGKTSTARTAKDTITLPSSYLSPCNVTLQDTTDRSMDEFTTGPADLGEAGRLRKKTEAAASKTTVRFRPTQSKSKKDAKLEFFGFDEQEGEEDPLRSTGGAANYKIKYFGFDDLSESSDEDDGTESEGRRKKKASTRMGEIVELLSSSESTGDSQGSQPQSQDSTNTDSLEFSDESNSIFSDVGRKPMNRQEKAKENTRKIFHGPKRSPTKAVYNARHWNQPEPEELPPTLSLSHNALGSAASKQPLTQAQTAPAVVALKETTQKDEGVFKAPPPPPRVIKTVTIPTQPYQDIVTALKCRKEDKELYTVVQHVKHFNDVVEFGENQEFTDDIEYLLSGLKCSQPLNTRCLSIISLATKCAMPSFRMHLRAHGMVAMVFKTLDDAQKNQNLALCTAALMYILSRDRLNMDLDRASLDLMIRLLEMDQDPCSRQLNEKEMKKIKEKIRKLCETVHNRHLDLENITTGHLAMETLLSLTSKRAGDWFKEELRLLGGLDHIVDKVKECVEQLGENEEQDKLVASLWGAERCLRVLESVTVHNPENQGYLIAYKDSQLIISSARALRHCEQLIARYNREENKVCMANSNSLPQYSASSHTGKAVEDCMRAIFGVLLNLTNDNEWGSTKTGEQDNLISTTMNCVLQVPQYIPQEQRFDIRVLGLGLLINLVEHSARNRHCLVDMETPCSFDSFCAVDGNDSLRMEGQVGAIEALVQLFLQRERAARLAETETDDFIKDTPVPPQDQSGQWQETAGSLEWVQSENCTKNENEKKEEEDEEIDLNKALQHAGKHMEDCIVASYTALLLGCLCQESPVNVTTVRELLPEGDFSIMTEMLHKFLNFMNLTCAVGTTGQKSISRVIEYLDHC